MIISPPALREVHARRAYVLLFFVYLKIFLVYFSDFCQINYLNIYRTDLHEICRIYRTFVVDEQSVVMFFSIPQGTLPWQPILRAKSTSETHLVVRMTFTRAAPPANDKNEGQKLLCRAQTNKLPDSVDAGEPID